MADPVSPRKMMAAGGTMPKGDFGVQPLSDTTQTNSRGNERGKSALSDDNRTTGKPVPQGRNKLPSQAHPDHGDHYPYP